MLKKRSITLYGHSTSVALEPEFWNALEALALAQGANLTTLIGRIDEGRAGRPLASACRIAALRWAQGLGFASESPLPPRQPGLSGVEESA